MNDPRDPRQRADLSESGGCEWGGREHLRLGCALGRAGLAGAPTVLVRGRFAGYLSRYAIRVEARGQCAGSAYPVDTEDCGAHRAA
jgi:hypothetical protein